MMTSCCAIVQRFNQFAVSVLFGLLSTIKYHMRHFAAQTPVSKAFMQVCNREKKFFMTENLAKLNNRYKNNASKKDV